MGTGSLAFRYNQQSIVKSPVPKFQSPESGMLKYSLLPSNHPLAVPNFFIPVLVEASTLIIVWSEAESSVNTVPSSSPSMCSISTVYSSIPPGSVLELELLFELELELRLDELELILDELELRLDELELELRLDELELELRLDELELKLLLEELRLDELELELRLEELELELRLEELELRLEELELELRLEELELTELELRLEELELTELELRLEELELELRLDELELVLTPSSKSPKVPVIVSVGLKLLSKDDIAYKYLYAGAAPLFIERVSYKAVRLASVYICRVIVVPLLVRVYQKDFGGSYPVFV